MGQRIQAPPSIPRHSRAPGLSDPSSLYLEPGHLSYHEERLTKTIITVAYLRSKLQRCAQNCRRGRASAYVAPAKIISCVRAFSRVDSITSRITVAVEVTTSRPETRSIEL